jgi:hypothetical protein
VLCQLIVQVFRISEAQRSSSLWGTRGSMEYRTANGDQEKVLLPVSQGRPHAYSPEIKDTQRDDKRTVWTCCEVTTRSIKAHYLMYPGNSNDVILVLILSCCEDESMLLA